jgi:hypothetical protein
VGAILDAAGYDTDKSPHYLRVYATFLAPLVEREVRLLELGVGSGGSLLLWRDYFPHGIIAGLDVRAVDVPDATGRIRIFRGAQQDPAVLDAVARAVAPEGFDVIVDDASHVGASARASFWHLFRNHLKSGGIYAIEDWGTGYWPSWPDGARYAGPLLAPDGPRAPGDAPSPGHAHGMVALVKELVDECAASDFTADGLGVPPERESRIARMQVSLGQVIVVKA